MRKHCHHMIGARPRPAVAYPIPGRSATMSTTTSTSLHVVLFGFLIVSLASNVLVKAWDDEWVEDDNLLTTNSTDWNPTSPGTWICYSTARSKSSVTIIAYDIHYY